MAGGLWWQEYMQACTCASRHMSPWQCCRHPQRQGTMPSLTASTSTCRQLGAVQRHTPLHSMDQLHLKRSWWVVSHEPTQVHSLLVLQYQRDSCFRY